MHTLTKLIIYDGGFMDVRVITNITKEYPNMIKVMIYKEPQFYECTSGRIKRNKREVNEKDYVPSITSLGRTKTLIRDIVQCNDFELFCTFTFDPDKVYDRFNLSCCWHRLQVWLRHQKEKSPDFKYLFIPEQHKSGAWHFHGLMSNYKGSLRDSKHKSSSGYKVYNITSYRGGFSTAVYIENSDAVCNYVLKYITKDFIKTFNQRRFFCSRNLIRPKKSINSPIFSMTFPSLRRKAADLGDRELYYLLPDSTP